MTARLLGACLGAALVYGGLSPAESCHAKPPDLPTDPKVTLAAEVEVPVDALLYAVHPLVGVLGEEPAPAEVVTPAVESPCTRPRDAAAPAVTSAPGLKSVLDNLQRLESAGGELEKAKALLRAGHTYRAMQCARRASLLCPGSRVASEADEVLASVKVFGLRADDSGAGRCPCDLQAALDAWDGLCATAGSAARWWDALLAGRSAEIVPADMSVGTGAEEAQEEEEEAGARVGLQLDTHVSVRFASVPLRQVLAELSDSQCVPLELDLTALHDRGVTLTHPITLTADGVPFRTVLDLVLRQADLVCQVTDGVVRVTATARPAAPAAGVKEQVEGLMKACHLALGDGRFEKAADLAREAHALDDSAVEADPVVYKLHLLVVEETHRKAREAAVTPASFTEPRPNEPVAQPKQGAAPVPAIQSEPLGLERLHSAHLVRDMDQLVGNADAIGYGAFGYAPVQEPSPLARFLAPAVAEARDWVEHVPAAHGYIVFGPTMPGVVGVWVRFVGEECCYNAFWSVGHFALYKTPVTPADEAFKVQAEAGQGDE